MSNELLTRLKAQSSELKEICFKSVFGMALRDVSPKGFFLKQVFHYMHVIRDKIIPVLKRFKI